MYIIKGCWCWRIHVHPCLWSIFWFSSCPSTVQRAHRQSPEWRNSLSLGYFLDDR